MGKTTGKTTGSKAAKATKGGRRADGDGGKARSTKGGAVKRSAPRDTAASRLSELKRRIRAMADPPAEKAAPKAAAARASTGRARSKSKKSADAPRAAKGRARVAQAGQN